MLFRNKAEFKSVFEAYYNPLCNFIKRLGNDNTLAEDVVQDVFLHLWKTRQQYNQDTDIKSLLFQASKHKLFEYLRKDKAYEKHLQNFNGNQDLSADEDQLAESLLKLEKINQSLRHLPTKCRLVFEMHKFKGLTYSEIAEINNISIKTVENHMLKAIKILRTLLTN